MGIAYFSDQDISYHCRAQPEVSFSKNWEFMTNKKEKERSRLKILGVRTCNQTDDSIRRSSYFKESLELILFTF